MSSPAPELSPSVEPARTADDASPDASPARVAPAWVAPAAVALLAAALRFWNLGRVNLWLDEVSSVVLARKSVAGIVDDVAHSPHGPAYYLLLKGWTALFGGSEGAVRGLSAVAGLAVVLIVYRIGARLGGARLATLAALLVALSPVQIYYAQEARFHMVSAALAVASLAGYLWWRERAVRALDGDAGALAAGEARGRALLRFALPAALALYAYPLYALMLAALWLDAGLLVLSREGRGGAWRVVAREWLLLQVALAAGCVPLALGLGLGTAAVSATQVWRPALGAWGAASDFLFYFPQQIQSRFLWWDGFAVAWRVYGDPTRWGNAHPLLAPIGRAVSLPGACAAVALCLAAALRQGRRSPWRAVWLALLVPLAVEAAISVRQSLELSRYALFVAPPLFLLVARGLVALPRAAAGAALAVILTTEILGLRAYYVERERDSNYRRVAAVLAGAARAGDSVVVRPGYAAPAVAYYTPPLAFDTRSRSGYGWSVAGVPGAAAPTGRWWLVVDYRATDSYGAPADSLAAAVPLAGLELRVLRDTMLRRVRVLELAPR